MGFVKKLETDNKHNVLVGNMNNFKKRIMDHDVSIVDLTKELKRYKDIFDLTAS